MNVPARLRRNAAVTGPAMASRKLASAAPNRPAGPARHRSRNPQQPKRSRYTDEAMSLTA